MADSTKNFEKSLTGALGSKGIKRSIANISGKPEVDEEDEDKKRRARYEALMKLRAQQGQ